MKKILKLTAIICISFRLYSQSTPGTLTFTYTPVSKGTSSYVLAIWMANELGAGNGRTLRRYCDAATSSRLPTWAMFSGCGFVNGVRDATSSSCRTNGAILGGPLTTFASITTTWDGIENFGNLVPDGVTSIAIEEAWGAASNQRAFRYFTFNKSAAVDDQTTGIPNDANFTNISLIWQPNLATKNFGILEATIAPNPSKTGLFEIVSKSEVTNCKVYNLLGALVFEDKTANAIGDTKTVDLSAFANGLYFLKLANDTETSTYKIVIEK